MLACIGRAATLLGDDVYDGDLAWGLVGRSALGEIRAAQRGEDSSSAVRISAIEARHDAFRSSVWRE